MLIVDYYRACSISSNCKSLIQFYLMRTVINSDTKKVKLLHILALPPKDTQGGHTKIRSIVTASSLLN